jgi:hypothetical protein
VKPVIILVAQTVRLFIEWLVYSLWKCFLFFLRLFGLVFLFKKFFPDDNKLPTGFIWLIGLYSAIFGITSQIYENQLDRLENRASILITALLNEKTGRLATLQIPKIKEKAVLPVAPEFLDPFSVFNSLFSVTAKHKDTIDRLDEALALLNKDLEVRDLGGWDLREANLQGANLQEANLRGANLRGVDLRGADLQETNITLEQLKKAKVYSSTKLPEHIDKSQLTLRIEK